MGRSGGPCNLNTPSCDHMFIARSLAKYFTLRLRGIGCQPPTYLRGPWAPSTTVLEKNNFM
jgi:hypothetical protein